MSARSGKVRALIDLRLRASRRLLEAVDAGGLTPRSRATWTQALETDTLAETLARRRRELSE